MIIGAIIFMAGDSSADTDELQDDQSYRISTIHGERILEMGKSV